MLIPAIAAFFKYKLVSSVIILTCWSPLDQRNVLRKMSEYGVSTTFSCNISILDDVEKNKLQGVLHIKYENGDKMLEEVKTQHFFSKYKWLLVGDRLPSKLRNGRYDADVSFLELNTTNAVSFINNEVANTQFNKIHFSDAYIHPRDGVTTYPWAYWTEAAGFVVTLEQERIKRRQDLKKYPLRIATPIGHYSSEKYDGTFVNWLDDESLSVQDPGLRCGYHTSMLLVEIVNAEKAVFWYGCGKHQMIPSAVGMTEEYVKLLVTKTTPEANHNQPDFKNILSINKQCETHTISLTNYYDIHVLIMNELWAAQIYNDSMLMVLLNGETDLAGGILRILPDRILDYVLPIWPFRVGFIYLAERESSTNMYLEPFSQGVWWACLAMMCVIALVQRITSKTEQEKDGALYTVLTTYLQQDASAVPECASGRWSFIVLSVSAMLVHAYYTSAIVSALMSTGKGGPETLRALADSKYAIAREEDDYMKYVFLEVETSWDDMEYLKKKKLTKSYVELSKGLQLIEQGTTAFHCEYNQIYPHFKKFSDDHICKIQHVDTVPETLTWITSPKDSQWTEVLRAAGMWLHETGIGKRLVTRLRIRQPPCRAALLAERVKLGDVAPLLFLTLFGVILSLVVLGMEIFVYNLQKYKNNVMKSRRASGQNEEGLREVVEYDTDNIIEI